MESLLSPDRQGMLAAFAGITLCYTIFIAIQRLYFSPIAKFPGPKLAALTWWHEFYYDAIQVTEPFPPSQAAQTPLNKAHVAWPVLQDDRPHARRLRYVPFLSPRDPDHMTDFRPAGPIVRINPTEVHVKDPDWYEELYTGSSRPRNKSDWYVGRLGGGSIAGTHVHDLHRVRRSAFNHMFSKRAIEALGPVLQDKIDTLCRAVEGYLSSGEVLNLDLAFVALTIDMISEYAFGQSFGVLEKPGFSQEWRDSIIGLFESAIPLRHFGWIAEVLLRLPDWVVSKINRPTAAFLENQAVGELFSSRVSWHLWSC